MFKNTPSQDILLTISDYERAATLLLPVQYRGFFNGGSEDEVTLRENTRAFQDYTIRPFVLRNALSCSLKTSFLSNPVDQPIGISPTAFHKLAHPDGELGTVRGAKASKSLMVASAFSSTSLEEMKREAGILPMWFQMNPYKDHDLTQSILRRAESAGYSAIVLTLDIPILGRRLTAIRDGFRPSDLMMANFVNLTPINKNSSTNDSIQLISYVSGLKDSLFTWNSLEEFTKSTSLPVIAKGVLRAEDAVEAVRSGVKGIIVPVWMDGGIRNGRDVFKALALGATGVFVGRPVLWGLAVSGEAGVTHVMKILRQELEDTMKLAGCTSIKSIRDAKDVVVYKSFFERH